MNRKVRFATYGLLMIGMLIWWWSIPQPTPNTAAIYISRQPKVLLTDKIKVVKREDWTPEQEQLFKDYIGKNTQ